MMCHNWSAYYSRRQSFEISGHSVTEVASTSSRQVGATDAMHATKKQTMQLKFQHIEEIRRKYGENMEEKVVMQEVL